LIRAVRQEDEDLKMPQDGKLTELQIAELVRWVEMGAPFPAATSAVKRTRDPNHWAFQPPPMSRSGRSEHAWARRQSIASSRQSWKRRAVSRGAADKRTLIRRVTFDLAGLPPTMDEIAPSYRMISTAPELSIDCSNHPLRRALGAALAGRRTRNQRVG
jgi:hypothetical protein